MKKKKKIFTAIAYSLCLLSATAVISSAFSFADPAVELFPDAGVFEFVLPMEFSLEGLLSFFDEQPANTANSINTARPSATIRFIVNLLKLKSLAI